MRLQYASLRLSKRRNRRRRSASAFQVSFRWRASRTACRGSRWLIASCSACRTWGRARAPSSDSFVSRAGMYSVSASLAGADCSEGCQHHFRSPASSRNALSSSSSCAWPSSSSWVPLPTVHFGSLIALISSAYCRGFVLGRRSQLRGTTFLPVIILPALDSYCLQLSPFQICAMQQQVTSGFTPSCCWPFSQLA